MSGQESTPALQPIPPFFKMAIPGLAIGVLTLLFIVCADRFVDLAPIFVEQTGERLLLIYPCLAVGGFVAGWFAPYSGPGLVVWTFTAVMVGGGMAGADGLFMIDLILQAPAFLGEWIAWLIALWLAGLTGMRAHLATARAGLLALSAIVLSVVGLALWDSRHDVSGDFIQAPGYTGNWERHPVRWSTSWRLHIGTRVDGPVAIRGAVFATAGGILYGINSNGVGRWMLPGATTGPVLGKGEKLYVGLSSGIAHVDTATGRVRWIADITIEPPMSDSGDHRRHLSVGPSGTLYVNAGKEVIHAINPDGTVRWSFREDGRFLGAPIEGPDNRVYVAHNSRQLSVLALSPNGQKIWRTPLYGDGLHGVSVGDEVIAVPGLPYVYALRFDGTIKWRRRFSQAVYETAIDPRGHVFASTGVNWDAMDADGRALFGSIGGGPPAFADDLTIFASHKLQAVGHDGRLAFQAEHLWQTNENLHNESVVAPDGMLYVQLPSRLMGVPLPTPP